MKRRVIITTPMPTLDEIGKRLGLSKADQNFLIRLVDAKMSKRSRNGVHPAVAGPTSKKKLISPKTAVSKRKSSDRNHANA